MNKLEKYLENYQSKLFNKIHKVSNNLDIFEMNILKTLNSNYLLLDIDYEIDELGRKVLVAYNLQRQIILCKKLYTKN